MKFNPQSVTGTWSYPTTVRFGPGRIVELSEACATVGMTRPLLVTDPGLRDLPMVQDALAATRRTGLATEVFSELQPNPLDANVAAGVAAYTAGSHDGVIAFGGGSALDAGKAVAFMVGQSRPLRDFEDVSDNWRRAAPDAIAPVVAVPTTAGTGSEVGRAAVITDATDARKRIIFHPGMMPRIVIADPVLTRDLPPALTAATGMDALTHCLEAYLAPGYHPLADGVALGGLRLAMTWLPKAYANGTDLEARAQMMAAAAMGATAFQKGLGAVHSISHAVGSLYGTHHGLTNAVVLPYVMRFNRPAIEDKCRLIGRLLALPKVGFEGVLQALLDLRATVGIAHSLAELGVDEARADAIAALAFDDPTRPGNPAPVTVDDLREVFLSAVRGTL